MSVRHEPMIIGTSNEIPSATITTTYAPTIGLIDYLRSIYYDARVPIWDPVPSSVTINGNWTSQKVLNYFALIGHNLPATAKVKLELFNSQNQAGVKIWENTADADGVLVTDLIPLGLWAYGVDPYGGRVIQQFPVPYIINGIDTLPFKPLSFRLTLNDLDTGSPVPDNFQIRALMAGTTYQLDYNFEHAPRFASHTDGEIAQHKGGGHSYAVLPVASRRLSIKTSQMTEGDRLAMDTHKRLHPGEPFLIQPYPNDTNINYSQQSFVAIHENTPVMSHVFLSMHASEFSFLEVK